MITTERIGDRLIFNVSGHTAYIEASRWSVTILACDHLSYDVEPASFEPDEAVAVLRAMLREIEGPSIDDLSHLFDVPRSYVEVVRASNGSDVLVRIGLYTYTAPTRREAMQAAWDSGVEMYGADT